MTIWKFPFEVQRSVAIRIPMGAKPLSVQLQDTVPCLWCLIDETQRTIEHHFRIYATGEPIQKVGSFIGTFQQGPFVWHMFEEP